MQPCRLLSVAAFLASRLAAAQHPEDADLGPRIAQLRDPAAREAAHRLLVASGARAVPALMARLQPGEASLGAVAAVLVELAPHAGGEFVGLRHRIGQFDAGELRHVVPLLAEIAPFRPSGAIADVRAIQEELARMVAERRAAGLDDPGVSYLRLRARMSIDPALDVDDLIAIAAGHRALRVETAVDLLAVRGAAATSALPVLQRLLERREPRLLGSTTDTGSSGTVPLHRKAARAVLAIAPAASVAELARARLLGDGPPARADAPTPDRLRRRLDELVQQLGEPDTQAAAGANLEALGASIAAPLAEALADQADGDVRRAGLAVLRALGPRAGTAVPALFTALPRWDATLTGAILDVLAVAAPWCDDVLPEFAIGYGADSLWIAERPVPGSPGLALANEFPVTVSRFRDAMAVDPAAPLPELAALLVDPSSGMRRAALVALRERGPAAAGLVPRLAAMLSELHPVEVRHEFLGPALGRTTEFDPSDELQRLAASAILAIADHGPTALRARARLARPAATTRGK